MKIKLFDEQDEKQKTFDISGWDCMKIGFLSYLGWALFGVVLWMLLFVLAVVFGAI